MKTAIWLGVLALLGFATVDFTRMFRVHGDLERKVESRLGAINRQPEEEIVAALVEDARALGIRLRQENIRITSEDTATLSPAQAMLAGMATFRNKRVEIQVDYVARPVWFKVPRQVRQSMLQEGPPQPLRHDTRAERSAQEIP